jgi:hypothetical protein
MDTRPFTEFFYTPEMNRIHGIAKDLYANNEAFQTKLSDYDMTRDELMNHGFKVAGTVLGLVKSKAIKGMETMQVNLFANYHAAHALHTEMFCACINDLGSKV